MTRALDDFIYLEGYLALKARKPTGMKDNCNKRKSRQNVECV